MSGKITHRRCNDRIEFLSLQTRFPVCFRSQNKNMQFHWNYACVHLTLVLEEKEK